MTYFLTYGMLIFKMIEKYIMYLNKEKIQIYFAPEVKCTIGMIRYTVQ